MTDKPQRFKTGKYAGNKWGGKYLRAPDIFYTILEKGKDKLVRLGDIAEVRFGIKTGANEFFYLDKEKQEEWRIEEEYLKPVIKSPKECEMIIIDPRKLKYKLFMCHKPKSQLKGTNALRYIDWGEEQEIEIKQGGDKGSTVKGYQNLQTISNRKIWYSCSEEVGNTFWVKEVRERIAVFISDNDISADCRLYLTKTDRQIQAILNTTLTALLAEIHARNIGGGGGPRSMMVYEVNNQVIISPKEISHKLPRINREVKSIFEECGFDDTKPIRDQDPKPIPDRAELDNIIFDELGLTKEERKEVYWCVCELVKQRLDKANSLEGE